MLFVKLLLRARHWLRALSLILNPHVRLVLLSLPWVRNQVLKVNSPGVAQLVSGTVRILI